MSVRYGLLVSKPPDYNRNSVVACGLCICADVLNPVEWYKDVKEVVAGDQSADSKSMRSRKTV